MAAKNLLLSKDLPYDLKVRSIDADTISGGEKITGTLALTGAFAANVNYVATIVSNVVTLQIDSILQTAVASALNFTGLDPQIIPANELELPIKTVESGAGGSGTLYIKTDGTGIFYYNLLTGFSAGNNRGWQKRITVTYIRD